MTTAPRRFRGTIKPIVIGLLLLAICSMLLAPSAAAWNPPSISRTTVNKVDSADESGFGETHKIGPLTSMAPDPPPNTWMKVIYLVLNKKFVTPQQPQVTGMSTDAVLTGQSDLNSRATNCR